MFYQIAERVYFYLEKKNILDDEDKEVYIYALEIIILNMLLLFALFAISLFLNKIDFFVCYLSFFVPIRIFSGGYHFKRSEVCFVVSIGIYVLMMMSVDKICVNEGGRWGFITVVLMFLVAIFSPLENENHPMTNVQRKRNKWISRIILTIDVMSLLILYTTNNPLLINVVVLLLLNGMLFLIGVLVNSKKLIKGELEYD